MSADSVTKEALQGVARDSSRARRRWAQIGLDRSDLSDAVRVGDAIGRVAAPAYARDAQGREVAVGDGQEDVHTAVYKTAGRYYRGAGANCGSLRCCGRGPQLKNPAQFDDWLVEPVATLCGFPEAIN